ncbi:phage major head protein [Escherichia coli]|uniref:Phage major head protein n=1 Tax=Escherichia coli TaxID=562 RepID=A0A377EB13_ECOLX|nr:phage major head protein [Escherichia coli]
MNIAIMDGTVWRLLNGFKLFREKLDTRRGSNSQLETAVKDLGAVVSFKGITAIWPLWWRKRLI